MKTRNAQHTPRPWKYGESIGFNIAGGVFAQNGHHIADVVAVDSGKGKANARLIAAAPDLLAALKTAWSNLDDKSLGRAKWTRSDQRAFEAITAAIAKAEAP